jgi:hypothetical protein
MKKILSHLRSDWYKYALEILVITVGILGAFALNSWNETRKELAAKKNLLTEMREEVISNIEVLEEIIQYREQSMKMTDSLLSYFFEEHVDLTEEEFESMLDDALNPNFFTYEPILGYQQSTINSGQINLINNTNLIKLLTQFESKAKNAGEGTSAVHEMWLNDIGPLFHKYVRSTYNKSYPSLSRNEISITRNHSKLPCDVNGFFQDAEVENWLLRIKDWMLPHNHLEIKLMQELKLTLQLIDEELT